MITKKLAQTHIVDIPHALDESIRENPEKTALIYFGRKITYCELGRGVMQFSRLFEKLSGGQGKKYIALLMPNIPQFVMAYYGALRSENIAVPVNFASVAKKLKFGSPKTVGLEELEDVRAQISSCRPRIIVIADLFWPIVEKIRSDFPYASIVVVGIADLLPGYLKVLYPIKAYKEDKLVHIPREADISRFKVNVGDAREEYRAGDEDVPDEVAQLQYTGGSTGGPKAVMLSHRNVVSNAWQCREHLSFLGENEVVLGALPFFHVYGLTVCLNITLLALRGTLVLMPVFSPKEALKLIKRYGVTLFPGINRIFQSISDYAELENLHSDHFMAVSGAGHLDKRIKAAFESRTGSVILNGYGLSEASPVLSVELPGDHVEGSIGRPIPGTEIRIVSQETGEDIASGSSEVGEIVARGPQVMQGYLGNAEATAKAVRNGWLHTGDIGRLDQEGRLYIVDRADDMAKVSGEKVFSAHVEENILRCTDVLKCVVIFADDVKRGKAPIAFVVVREGISGDDVARWSRSHMQSGLWLPREIISVSAETFEGWEEITGKIKRKKIRDYYLQTHKAG
ncbi:MAG: AMP-binding protein [Candidatus Liptonbacteria bacterium]|nr:AMP-binding protein [Candidatus Liptonbacteria bacterium]